MTISTTLRIVVVGLAQLGLATATLAADIVDLGVGYAYDVSNGGQVVGSDNLGFGNGFIWSSTNGRQSIGGTAPSAINAAGAVTGGGSSQGENAFLYQNGNTNNFGGSWGVYSSKGMGINDQGTVAGWNYTDQNRDAIHAFTWNNGVRTDLGSLFPTARAGGSAIASDINNLGQVVGYSAEYHDSFTGFQTSGVQAFLYTNGAMRGIGAGFANAINDNGQVVGTFGLFNSTNGTYQGLGFNGLDINNWGQAVGSASGRAYAWTKELGTVDLNSFLAQGSGWTLYSAEGINLNGDVVGYGSFNGRTHAFLLKGAVTAPIPEPETYAMLLAGLGLLGVMARRRGSLSL
jgi:probable HAF family extracellular repeat protein